MHGIQLVSCVLLVETAPNFARFLSPAHHLRCTLHIEMNSASNILFAFGNHMWGAFVLFFSPVTVVLKSSNRPWSRFLTL